MTPQERFDEKWIPVPESGCWLWTEGCFSHGYAAFWLDGRQHHAHRVSWEFNVGPIPEGLCVLHKCDVKSCVNPAHLFIGTQADNMQDMVRKGRKWTAPGEAHSNAKLTEAAVLAIRADERPYRIIADELGVSQALVCNIRQRTAWTHL